MQIRSKLTRHESDSDLRSNPLPLGSIGQIPSLQVLTASERAYVAALDLPLYSSLEMPALDRSKGLRLCWHLIGILIVLTVVMLTPFKRLPSISNHALTLSLSPTANPNSGREVPAQSVSAESTVGPVDRRSLSEANPVAIKAQPSDLSGPARIDLRASISAAKAEVLRSWSATNDAQNSNQEGSYQVQGTVFDSHLKARLSHIAPSGLLIGAESSAMADGNGVQEVILGDQCFQVTKLDDQAMRGMGVWTRGNCEAVSKSKQQIKLRGPR